MSIQNTPHSAAPDFLVHRVGSKVGSIGPGGRSAIEIGCRKESGIAQRLEDSRICPIDQCGNIDDAARSIVERDRQLPFREYAECAQTPRRGGDYSSGLMGFGNCLARHRFQEFIRRKALRFSALRLVMGGTILLLQPPRRIQRKVRQYPISPGAFERQQ